MRAVIMAGGKGTRLQPIAEDIPKPMIPIYGKPVLEYQIESLKKSGITDVTLIVGHLGNVIREYFKSGNQFGMTIDYIVEERPLGTAGALYYLKNKINEDFLLLFGDLILDVDFGRFMDFHKKSGALITLYAHPNAHPYDSDVIVIDDSQKVLRIEPKNTDRDFYYHNLVNAGIYSISPEVLKGIETAERIDLEKNMITKYMEKGMVCAYHSTEYVKDMGTPDRLDAVCNDIKNGIVASRSLREKQRAIFLDRDGTVNRYVGFLKSTHDFELIEGASEAIKRINQSPYLAIVVTNQPVIARGEVTFEELEEIHKKMETELGRQGAYIDDLFFCPHHPHKGYEGEISDLKIHCSCRKPQPGMLYQAAEKYNIDLEQSWFIGDTTTDIQTGFNAGMKTILVQTGEAGKDKKYNVEPNYKAKTLLNAVEYILNGHEGMDRGYTYAGKG